MQRKGESGTRLWEIRDRRLREVFIEKGF